MQLKLRHALLLATINYTASQLLPMRRCARPEGKIPLLVSDPGTGALILMHASIRWDAKGAITHIPTDKTVLSTYEKTGAEFFLKQESQLIYICYWTTICLDLTNQPACFALTKGELGTHQAHFTCFISALFLTISCTWPPFQQLPVRRSSKIILPSISEGSSALSKVIISLIIAHKMG